MICEICGAKMQYVKDGHTVTWICNNCKNGVAATCYEPYEIDETVYHVHLKSAFSPNPNDLRIIAKIANCNYLQAKKMIENAPTEIFCGRAVDVKKIKEKFEAANIEIKIEPEFPYQ